MRVSIFWFVCLVMTLTAAGAVAAPSLPEANAGKLPQWRGFNLLNKFFKEWSNGPFLEEDFALISELGFNFVRLPMDYRVWIKEGDWRVIDDSVLDEIAQAVEWGERYGVHVCINFHRAPGYTVAKPAEEKDLWTDPEALEVCALHWAHFAKRFKGIPNTHLSFNLMNEPSAVDGETYARVARALADAIRAEDPVRLIICDGLEWGRLPCMELEQFGVAQATRGYEPSALTHYLASWVYNDRAMSVPVWPMPQAYGFLYGPMKPELQSPMLLLDPPAGELRLQVGVVSSRSRLALSADGESHWTKDFICGPGEGEWRKAEYMQEWNTYQNTFDKDYTIPIPAGVKQIEISNVDGDWLSLNEIGFKLDGKPEILLGLKSDWGKAQTPIRIVMEDGSHRFATEGMVDGAWLREHMIAPWKALKSGVMVGEFGAFNKTPHDVTLRWMEDCLKNWKEAGWGWALWNFRGEFGILDSNRADVQYEDWKGHKLDREMLTLLQRY